MKCNALPRCTHREGGEQDTVMGESLYYPDPGVKGGRRKLF